jgi:muconolactone delta-isomerase
MHISRSSEQERQTDVRQGKLLLRWRWTNGELSTYPFSRYRDNGELALGRWTDDQEDQEDAVTLAP